MLGFASGLGGLIQPRDALVISRHGEEKQNNTLNESNTIRTLVSILCPQTLWALVLIAVSGHSPKGGAHGASHTVPSPILHAELTRLELSGLAGWVGLPVLEAAPAPLCF